ncbi:hypothetical protein JL722_13346 [Aureococcus anophagefferens]|nr:hypothetical protein JL722_13346 [Aureococcus anophagefferens]
MVRSMGSVGSLVVLLATFLRTASRPGHAPGRRGRRPLDAVEHNRTSKRRNASAANATREKFVFFVNMWNATQPCGEPAPDMTLITGTGRAGTSFLIALLTRLGLPTGYGETDVRTAAARRSHAGLERSIRMCRDERNRSVAVDAANGSVRVARSRERHAHGNGGFWRGAENADAQQRKDAELLAGLFYDLEMADKATTTLAFPRSARDEAYCRAKLGWLLDEYGVDARAFNRSYRATANRSMTRDRDRAPPPEPTFWWSGYDHANWTWPAWQGWNATPAARPAAAARPAGPGAGRARERDRDARRERKKAKRRGSRTFFPL